MNHLMYELNTLTQVMISVFLWHQIGKPKYSYFKTVTAVYLPLAISYVIFSFFIHSKITDNIYVFIRIAILIAGLFLNYKDSFLKKAFMFAIILFSQMAIEEVVMVILPYIFHQPAESFDDVSNALFSGMMMSADFELLVVIFISLIYKRKDFNFRKNVTYLLIIILFIAVHLISLIVYYSDNSVIENPNNNLIQFVYQSLLLILIFVQYFNMLHIQKLMETEENLRRLESEMKHTYDYYMLANEKFSEISKLRHDMQNQLQTVKYLIADGKNTGEAQKIMEQIQQRLSASKALQFCRNPIINSVMNIKLNEINGCDVETNVVLKDCDNLPFDNYDICSLFANLFDNAFEACQRMESSEERFIEMKSGIHGNYFILKVQNSCTDIQPKGRPPESSKPEPDHGYGTKIIDNIAKKYDGSFQLEYEDGVMSAIVIMNMG